MLLALALAEIMVAVGAIGVTGGVAAPAAVAVPMLVAGFSFWLMGIGLVTENKPLCKLGFEFALGGITASLTQSSLFSRFIISKFPTLAVSDNACSLISDK